MKFIINADDCGYSREVNDKIEECIKKGYISSTTIMANMPDVEQAKVLYDRYRNTISFGVHLNLTEGTPTIYNQQLLDENIYQIDDNGILKFNNDLGSTNKIFKKEICDAIFKELSAQIEIVMDLGIDFSHIDSHHHVHTRPFMLRILPRLQKKYHFDKIRRMRNHMPFSASKIARQTWWYILKCMTNDMKTTDYFTSFISFMDATNGGYTTKDGTIELMVHPGGYENEIEEPLLWNTNLKERFGAEIINYNQL